LDNHLFLGSQVGLDPGRAAAAAASTARRLLRRWRPLRPARGLRVDHHAAPAAAAPAVARWDRASGALLLPATGAVIRLGGRGLGRGRLLILGGRGVCAVAGIRAIGTERARDVALVDARGRGLDVEAGLLERRKDLLAGDPALLGYLMDSLLRHRRSDSKKALGPRLRRRRTTRGRVFPPPPPLRPLAGPRSHRPPA